MNRLQTKKTLAQKWCDELVRRTKNIDPVQIGAQERVVKILDQLRWEYAHIAMILMKKGERVGVRRVFSDRSYCDQYYADAGTGIFTFGTMTEGMLGEAANGAIIH